MWTSPKSDSKTASHLVSLTMRLKDKLHAQRIKHHQRSKPPDLNLQDHTLLYKPGCVLLDHQRAVISSLQYFKAVVDRLGVDTPGGNKQVLDQTVVGNLVGGTSTDVLEAVQTLVRLEPHLKTSKTISTCLTSLYQSLAQLIGWADQVLLQGCISHEDEKATAGVTTVIRAVLDKVKDLVRFAGERQDGCVPLSPVLSEPDVEQWGDVDDQESWSCSSPAEELTSPPPKPQMPFFQLQLGPGPGPPALPPKKRSSSGKPPCRVAIVAPMRREPEANTQTQECDDDPLKRRSSCTDSSAEVIHCDSEVIQEADPDYQFLHTDLSCFDALPPILLPLTIPPALPEKKRCNTADTTNSQTTNYFESDLTTQELKECTDPDDTVTSPLSPVKSPPPLPEKKRHIHQYLKICSSYSAQSTAMFYQTPQTFGLSHSPKELLVETSNQLMQTHLETEPLPDSDSNTPPGLSFAPALPPKKKQQDHHDPPQDKNQKEGGRNSLQEEKCDQWSKDKQDDLLLTDHQEIFNRITMKTKEEEGPDVKAASSEVLLVYATETDSSTEIDLYCEAFLATFRTFISPLDVISKLQHRYRHFCSGHGAKEINAAKNTFQLLVRVVDELSVMELEADLLQSLTDMVFKHLTDGELGLAHLLRSTVLSKLELKWHCCSTLSTCPLAARGVTARPKTLLDFRSQDLAEQLTLMDSQLFYKIERPEVLMWSKEQNEEKSPNLTEFTQHFNNVSFWVRSVIILQEKPQDREKLMLKFLKIMKHLRKLNNFNSYLAILSALDSAPLRRLDWQRSTAESLEELSSLIDSSSSFRAYRAALAEVEPPCIPYLGLILQDLTFVHLGNPDTLMTSQGKKVNFSKRWQQFNILCTLKNYQQAPYSLQPSNDIILFFNGFSDHLAEEALWEMSLRLKPRNTPKIIQR